MTKRARIILFLFLAILFILVAPLTVFYSLGWKIDWENKKIIQPGVFYFRVWPKNTQIYLNGKLKKKTDFFFGSALIENLIPKKYDVEIKKEGFHNWRKTLEIKERGVTEAKNIILIPENQDFIIISKNIKNFYFSPDEKKIILQELTTNQDSTNKEGWALKLFELEKNVKSHLIDKKDISKEEVQLIDLKFSPDAKIILLEVELKESLRYYILPIDQYLGQRGKISSLDFLSQSVEKVYFNPKTPQKLLVLLSSEDRKTSVLSEADLLSRKVSPPVLKNVITCSIFNDNIYYLETSGLLFRTDFSFNQREKINIIPLSLKKETAYKIAIYNSHIFLQENDILYILDENKKSFQKIFEPIKNFRISPDFNKLVYFNDYEISVLFLEKKYDQPQKEAGDQIFITRFSEKINKVFWYTNDYLIFAVGNKIKIAEIDDRDKINIFDFGAFNNPEIFWSRVNKKIFILAEKNFYSSEVLTP